MEGSTIVGVDRHGIGIEFTLENQEGSMVGRGTIRSKGSKNGEGEVGGDGGGDGGHGGAQKGLYKSEEQNTKTTINLKLE
jgi:hypothetical protein